MRYWICDDDYVHATNGGDEHCEHCVEVTPAAARLKLEQQLEAEVADVKVNHRTRLAWLVLEVIA